MNGPVEHLDGYVRGWSPPPKPTGKRRREASRKKAAPSAWSITFDCETFTDAAQGLRFGTYQTRRGTGLVAAGFFYEPDALTAAELDLLHRYAKRRRLKVLTREEFVRTELLQIGWKLRGRIIGFNLPFDLVRLAVGHDTARTHGTDQSMANAFTLKMHDSRTWPRIQVKRTGARSCFIRFTEPEHRHPQQNLAAADRRVHRGFFNDVATIAAATLGGSFSLARLCETLQTETRKIERDDHGQTLTADYLTYALDDVQATWECHQILKARWRSLDLPAALHELHSEASVAKAQLKKMGVRGWHKVQPDFPDRHIAKFLEAYFGGRTETRIRHTDVPVVVVDFTSQYPTVFSLQGLWDHLIADGIDMTRPPINDIRQLLEDIDTDQLLDPETWRDLNVIVKIRPDNDRLPTRARYAANGAPNVSHANRTGGPEQWFTLADAICSKLTTGRPPHIVDAYRIVAGQPQHTLRPITIGASDNAVELDPVNDDLMMRLIEQRPHARRLRDAALDSGDVASAALHDAAQQALKITANSIYGCTIELNTIPHTNPIDTTIVRPNGTTYLCRTGRTETPGMLFHPAIATLTCGGGRLLLQLAITLAEQAGGTYAYCDTDSLALIAAPQRRPIPCNGGADTTDKGEPAITAISHNDVTNICEQINTLNPYDRDLIPELLKVEHDSLNQPIRCWSIAAKRYALYTRQDDESIELVDRKEHGLGHLISPLADRSAFYDQWWLHILNLELGHDQPAPDWLGLPGIGRLAITTPRELANFAAYNHGKPYNQQIRPHGFLSTSHLHPHAIPTGSTGRLIAPVGTAPEVADWLNPSDPTRPTAITTLDPTYVIDGHAPVKTLQQLLTAYRLHPEAKANSPDGLVCGPRTSGLLQPRRIQTIRSVRCGKEANRYSDTPTTSDPADQTTEYPEPLCQHCGTGIDHRNGRCFCNDTCRKRHARANFLAS